jgi:hypothetical protein
VVVTQTQREFMAINSTAVPLWLALILFPRSTMTRRMMSALPSIQIAMGAAYTGLLVRAARQPDFPRALFDGDGWRMALATPQGFATGWTHFVVFDLFVGRWIWETALAEDRGCRVALTFACLAGPVGLMIFNLQRRLSPRR